MKEMCATTDTITCWEDINFLIAEKSVKKLQKRIAVAYELDEYDKVSSLQHKMIHSFYAKVLAVKIVSSNRGKNTPGIDDTLWLTSEDKLNAVLSLSRRGYIHKPLKRIYISKSNGKMRPLGIPTLHDRAMQTLYKFALEPIAETTADKCSFGFRRNLSARDAIIRCNDILSNPNYEWILKADIENCFDNISHKWILDNIPIDKEILKKFLECGYIENSLFYPTKKGVPQGGCISSVICNMTLDGLEGLLKKKFNDSVKMIRYADDIIVVGYHKPLLVQSVIPAVKEFLLKRGLQLSIDKTEIYHVNNGFTFLGFEIFKRERQIISVPTRKSINSLLEKISFSIIKNGFKYNDYLCSELKLIIRGWLNYYIGISTMPVLNGVEFEVISRVNNITSDNRIAVLIKNQFAKLII